jgi:hypothetical protein
VNSRKFAFEQENFKSKQLQASLPRRRKPAVGIDGEELTNRSHFKVRKDIGTDARCRPRAGLLEFQLNAKSGDLPQFRNFGLAISKSVAEKIHDITTRARVAKNH